MDFLSTSALTAAAVVLVVQEILKLRVVPLAFANKYPVPTNILLSVIVTFFMVPVQWGLENIGTLLVQIGTVAVIAAIAYNQLLAKSPEIKSMEGTGTK